VGLWFASSSLLGHDVDPAGLVGHDQFRGLVGRVLIVRDVEQVTGKGILRIPSRPQLISIFGISRIIDRFLDDWSQVGRIVRIARRPIAKLSMAPNSQSLLHRACTVTGAKSRPYTTRAGNTIKLRSVLAPAPTLFG